jgi:hypothetical protein
MTQRRNLTCLSLKPKFQLNVFEKLINAILILAVAVSVVAGMPLHSSSEEAGMMDCCKKALEQNGSPGVAAARLCCAMNCNEPGPTSSNSSAGSFQTGSQPSALIVLALPPVTVHKSLRAHCAPASLARVKPSYILNLALLI